MLLPKTEISGKKHDKRLFSERFFETEFIYFFQIS